jgi:hypothetical protein
MILTALASIVRGVPCLEQSGATTKRLTMLCQSQVNFSHHLSALTDDPEIEGVKKIGKLLTLSRNNNNIQLTNSLDKGTAS